ncbi:hypothetical protein VSS37_03855 [Candidatus Thiothrix sp. Deng01]|uniref:Replication protein n=1 Tax=Candidatus Thiothrix phosphatis TaxID=3112415 RepID=A0ABU6CU28_9GAMM|nr:hypothetical protein [Candidatus Thiothrix sp. Deng01]MEB4590106.1 hypothetical protein [Candidatus Thiothrix sp. Deng01]
MTDASATVVERPANLLGRAAGLLGDDYKPNKYGHDRRHFRFIMNGSPYKDGTALDEFGHNRKSHAVYAICEKIREYSHNPLAFMDIGTRKTRHYVKKHGGFMQQTNSQLREKLSNLSIYLVNHANFVSGVVGIRGYGKYGEFKCFDIDHAVRITGMTRDNIKVASRFLVENKMLERKRTFTIKEDGSYGGRPSVYRLTDEFWQKFRVRNLFEELSDFSYRKALKDMGNSIKAVAASLSARIPEEVQGALGMIKLKRPKKLRKDDWPEDSIQHYLAQLPHNKHQAFQARFIEIYQDNMSKGSDTSVREALKAAFRSIW